MKQLTIMEILTIFNSVVLISAVIFGIWYFWLSRFYIRFQRTFWMKKPYSIDLWYRNSSNRNSGATGLFTFHFRNANKMHDWDSLQFRNGNYKKKEACQ